MSNARFAIFVASHGVFSGGCLVVSSFGCATSQAAVSVWGYKESVAPAGTTMVPMVLSVDPGGFVAVGAVAWRATVSEAGFQGDDLIVSCAQLGGKVCDCGGELSHGGSVGGHGRGHVDHGFGGGFVFGIYGLVGL
jgi:hypothetical protein